MVIDLHNKIRLGFFSEFNRLENEMGENGVHSEWENTF